MEDGLANKWKGLVFMNPPYGSDTFKWMERLKIHNDGIALVFARTDTKWFQQCADTATGIVFIRGRVGFVPQDRASEYYAGTFNSLTSAGAPSILLSYGERAKEIIKNCGLGIFAEPTKMKGNK